MNIIKHAEGVYEIENFLTQDQQEMFLSCAEGDGWVNLNFGNTTKNLSDDILEKSKDVDFLIRSFFENFIQIYKISNIRRLTNLEFMWPHSDDGDPDDPRKIIFGIAIYLNDDFVGGELIYPTLGLSVTPKARSMVVHDASLRHQVFPVVSRDRYSITTFVFGDESTKFNFHT